MKKKTNKSEVEDLSENKPLKWQYLLFSTIPIYLFFSLLTEFAVNIPILDDWDAILGFIIKWTETNSIDKIKLIFSQHNEHRIAVSRAIYALFFYLSKDINFLKLGIIANVQLVVIFAVLTYFSSKYITFTWPIFSSVIALCIFDATNYENSMIAMAGMANYGVIMFFLLSLFFYSLKSKYFIFLALFFQITCAFSNGNGLIAGIVLVMYCIAKKNKIKTITCLVTFISTALLYFIDFTRNNDDLTGKNILAISEFFIRLIGGHFGPDNRIFASIILTIIAATKLYFYFKNRRKKEDTILPIIAIFVFTLISAASIAIFRSSDESKIALNSYSSRYLIYSHLYTIVVFLFLLHQFEKTKMRWILIGAISFFTLRAYTENYRFGKNMFNVYHRRARLNKYYYPDLAKAKILDTASCQKKIYCLEKNRDIILTY